MSEIGEFTIPLYVGTLTNFALFGVLAVQVYIYYMAFPNDRLSSKILVALVVIAEILQTLGDTRITIRIFGAGWGNPEILDAISWAWFSVPVLGSFIASMGQMFFAWRIYIIAKNLYVPAVIASLSAFQFAAGVWTGVDITRTKKFSNLHVMKTPEAWLAATAVDDLIIVAAMVFYLLKARQKDLKTKTAASLSRIIKITIETGVLCALAAVVVLYLFIAFGGNNYHLGVCIWLSKVYSNSILVVSAFFIRAFRTHIPLIL
ncbi:hypothetical protein MSAN_01725300 [Mycena sanguinolenta]|uniref:DUF6534 domain-containing protein n=1 Tax=Mycena sanguinolenta TaxID=230812 RepID=A0A8H6Y036_9AGAR|nr:hypothetical protein MSAN_01725300 [Mycena sanguinolenta]